LLVALLSFTVFGANEVEIFSWWTGGGEEAGLLAIIDYFNEMYPDVNVINATVAGGAGTNAKAVLKTRMLGGNPPDSFQVHAGMELTDTYVIPGMMEPLTPYLAEWGYLDKFPSDIMDICAYEGEVYSIPVNVHRGNVVFYNMEIAKEIGMEKAPKTWNEFFAMLDKAKDAGYIGISLGDKNKWPATHLFEDIMLSQFGPYKYNMLWTGEQSFDYLALEESLQILEDLLPYFNSDHAALDWQNGSRLVFEGKAFCNVMGDWAEGYFKELGWVPGEDFGWFAVPETDVAFMIVSDTFGLPKGAPNPENALKWLKTIGSVEAQDIFNPLKGSIPARVDADKSKYDVYLQWSMADFSTKSLCPSIAHGSAAPEGFITSLQDVLNRFISYPNVQQAYDDILFAAEDME
ncbi:MAG TPA: extracellular solute-binding protein, partial [Thermotogota bacterium]|nr:extracellular solute-binding protein [Thermotogota bacterium]